MSEKRLKTALSIRGDSYYCPLSFQLDAYWYCENACHHCYMRRLNRTWGQDLRPLDLELFEKTIIRGLAKKEPKKPLDWAIKQRKTIRFGNKADPYQEAEKTHRVSREAAKILLNYRFSFVIQTMFTENVKMDMDLFSSRKDLVSFMPIVSPGLNKDWEVLEKKGTTMATARLRDASEWQKQGFNVGINGEPYIPGYHTIEDFEGVLKALKHFGLRSYNTYHLHFNDLVAKNFADIGIDIERVWYYNQDEEWRKILSKLIDLSKKYDITLGCPDFVNSGRYQEPTNTCCGLNVQNPCTFNMISWKKRAQEWEPYDEIISNTWDGIGDKEFGYKLICGEVENYYTLKDIVSPEKSPGKEKDILEGWD